jgi:protein-glutamine gamma-glutamyltransferase
MKLLRSFPLLAFALVLLSIGGLCAAQGTIGLLLVAGTLAAMSWYITEGPRGRTLPRWVSNILVIGVSLNVFVDLFQHREDVLGVLGRFAVWLTLIKLYERRTARDHAHLLTLSLLLMMTGCLQSRDLLFGCILIVYAVLGLYVLLLHQLQASFEQSRDARTGAIPPGYRLVPPLKPIIGRHPTLHFRTQAAGIGMTGVVVSLVVFLVFPRDYGADMFGALRVRGRDRVVAFSPEVDLNTSGRINSSHGKVLGLKVTDSAGRVLPHDQPIHLRGAVLDQYNGQGRWGSSAAGRVSLETKSTEYADLGDGVEPGETVTQRITLNRPGSGGDWLFSMFAPTAVSFDSSTTLTYQPRFQTMRTGTETRHLDGYTIRAQADPTDATLRALTRNARPMSARGGGWFRDESGAVRSLAMQLLAERGLPQERPQDPVEAWKWNADAAGAFTRFLQSESFAYTLDLSGIVYKSASDDPIVRFLTDSRRGHCEYFASGLAALCHSVGIPARLAVGYIAYDFDDALQEYNVLESNAHAWNEVATGPSRWTTFDPTPPATLRNLHDIDATVADQFRWAYEQIEGNWSSNIVGYDGTAQGQLTSSFNQTWSRRFTAALEAVREWMEQVNTFFNVGPGGYIWMGIVALALVIAVVALVKLMKRTRAIRRTLQLQHVRGPEYQRLIRQLGFYLDMLRVLRRGGLPKPEWQPPIAFAAEISRTRPDEGSLVRRITDVFYEARYGRRDLNRERLEQARRGVEELARSLRVRM